MTETSPFPAAPEALDAAWLTTALRADGSLDPASRVTALRLGPVDLGGVNGDVYRVLPRYTGAPGPLTLIAKFPAHAPAARGVAGFQRWYEREVRAYRELNGPDGAAGALPMPGCHFAALGDDGGFFLLLDDLGARNQGDQLAGCSATDALTAVRTIARVHARWWDAPALGDALDWLPLTTVGLDHARPVQGAFARAWSAVAGAVDAPRGFAARVPRLIERYPDLLAEAARPPLTVIHGDYRLDNLFFDTTAGERHVRAIDWQFTSRCRGMYDVAYFAALDLQPDARRAAEPRLLAAYRETLAEAGVSGYDADQARRDYELGLMLTFATFVIGAAGEHANERMRAVHQVGLHRVAVAIVENDALALLG
jgi:hypothetical protein